jgi:hypothetical protein
VLLIAVVAAFLALSSHLPALPLCPFHYLTGVECPTCGTTRAVWFIVHCEFRNAWMMNPIGFIVVAAVVRRIAMLACRNPRFVAVMGERWLEITLLSAFFVFAAIRFLNTPSCNS